MQQTVWRAVAFIAMAAIVVFPGAAEAGSRSGQISGVSGQAGSKTTASAPLLTFLAETNPRRRITRALRISD